MNKLCRECEKKFESSNMKRVFCSRECYLKSHRMKEETRKCINCGNNFSINCSKPKKFCSLLCYSQYPKSEETLRKKRDFCLGWEGNIFKNKKFQETNGLRQRGRKKPFEVIQRLSQSHTGRKLSDSQKNKIKVALTAFYKDKKLFKHCEYCSSKFFVSPYRFDIARFCSKECYNQEAKEINKGINKNPWAKGLTIKTSEKIRLSREKANKTLRLMSQRGELKHKPENLIKIRQARAKQILPFKDTSIEVKIQNFLKDLNLEFFTHQYIKEIEHGYQCDILIPSMGMVIECDGDYWHKYPIGREIDHIRTSELIEKGFKVLRLWEREINKMNVKQFGERIKNVK